MRLIQTYNEYHLGDGFMILSLLRHLARLHPGHQFQHYAHGCYLLELLPMTEDIPNLALVDMDRGLPPGCIPTWKNAQGFWENHPDKLDYVRFLRRYYRRFTRILGFTDPIPTELLFDFPALSKFDPWGNDYDVLVVNSNPHSAQFLDYIHEDSLELMVEALVANGLTVITTKPSKHTKYCTQYRNMTCAKIGALSNYIPNFVGVSTGPSWLCFNKWNRSKNRILMVNPETVNLTGDTVNCRTITEAMRALNERGLI